jgi:hypothetical protein
MCQRPDGDHDDLVAIRRFDAQRGRDLLQPDHTRDPESESFHH